MRARSPFQPSTMDLPQHAQYLITSHPPSQTQIPYIHQLRLSRTHSPKEPCRINLHIFTDTSCHIHHPHPNQYPSIPTPLSKSRSLIYPLPPLYIPTPHYLFPPARYRSDLFFPCACPLKAPISAPPNVPTPGPISTSPINPPPAAPRSESVLLESLLLRGLW